MLTQILAQDSVTETLKRSVANHHLAHAYLFEGPGGVGKTKTAYALACALLCQKKSLTGCGACAICHRILEGQHPDVRIIFPRKEGGGNLKVEFVREEILPFTRYAPFEGRAAVLIFPDAELSFPPHQPEAANALLKTLEEPRPHVHFILISSRPKRLLDTIRSRCQSLRFSRLPEAAVKQILTEHHTDKALVDIAAALAKGRADRALWLAQENRTSTLVKQAIAINDTVSQGTNSEVLGLAETLTQDEHLDVVLDTLAWLYRDIAVSHLSSELKPAAFSTLDVMAALNRCAKPIYIDRLAARVFAIRRTTRLLERTANKQLVIESLLFELSES